MARRRHRNQPTGNGAKAMSMEASCVAQQINAKRNMDCPQWETVLKRLKLEASRVLLADTESGPSMRFGGMTSLILGESVCGSTVAREGGAAIQFWVHTPSLGWCTSLEVKSVPSRTWLLTRFGRYICSAGRKICLDTEVSTFCWSSGKYQDAADSEGAEMTALLK